MLKQSFLFWGCVNIKQDFLKNEEIKEEVVEVIGTSGERLGKMSREEALERAYDEDLDLVLVAPNANPPVCKILNYSKFKFEMAKKEKEARKNQKVVDIKEIRVTPNMGQHDFDFKCKNARSFLESGNKVKFSVKFRGRELNNVKTGEVMLDKFAESLADISVIEKKPFLEGKNMFLILAKK